MAAAMLAGGWAMHLTGQAEDLLPSLVTATMAAASIVYSLARAQDAAKDQHTLNLIARRFDEGDYARNVRIASELGLAGKVGRATKLAELFEIEWNADDDRKERMAAAYAIIPVLNYWEHVCTAYVDDRLNRQIFEDLVQDLVRELVGRYPNVIGDMRREESSNMEHLGAVWFTIASDEERRQLCRLLGPVPARLSADDQWRWSQLAREA